MYEFIVKKGAKSSPGRAKGVVFRENSKLWTKIHTRLTCLTVSSEEGRLTILLAHYNFWFYMGKAGYAAKLHKNALKSYLFIYSLYILRSDQR